MSFHKLVLLFIGFICLLITARILYSGSLLYLFLTWNIFLAWVPLLISSYLPKKELAINWKCCLVLGSWLLFFPNALYIITDLVHLEIDTIVPKWFDAVLLFASSAIGLIMAFASLYKVEACLRLRLPAKKVEILLVIFLFLGAFGVYLGRFLRWNSWDIVHAPGELMCSIVQRFIFPFDHLRTWSITLLLTITFYLLYAFVKKMPGYLAGQYENDKEY